MDANGFNLTRLTDNSAAELAPAWSPDRVRIAFNSTRDGNFEIYVMDADGSNQINVTNSPGGDGAHVWSPGVVP